MGTPKTWLRYFSRVDISRPRISSSLVVEIQTRELRAPTTGDGKLKRIRSSQAARLSPRQPEVNQEAGSCCYLCNWPKGLIIEFLIFD
jgi:hypothetical protein